MHRLSFCRGERAMQRLGGPVGAVRPREGARVETNTGKQPLVAQWAEDRAGDARKLRRKIDLTLEPVAEAKPQRVSSNVPNRRDARQREREHAPTRADRLGPSDRTLATAAPRSRDRPAL